MILEILTYPNQVLRQKSKPVELFDEILHKHLDDMSETMEHFGGVGLASVQVGKPISALIINLPVADEQGEDIVKKENLIEAINPKIISSTGSQVFNEGCLSVPDFTADISRAKDIELTYQDRYGKQQTIKATDYIAVAWLHEIEHLNGKLFIENLKYTDRKKFEKTWRKEKKHYAKNRIPQ